MSEITAGVEIEKALVAVGFMPSLSEARRAMKENSISINKEKVSASYVVGEKDLIKGRYIVLQRGKKNYFLVTVK